MLSSVTFVPQSCHDRQRRISLVGAHHEAQVKLNLLRHVLRATTSWAHSRTGHGHCLSKRSAYICREAIGPAFRTQPSNHASQRRSDGPFRPRVFLLAKAAFDSPEGTRTFRARRKPKHLAGRTCLGNGRTINSCVFFPIDRYVSRFEWIAQP
jgi:hypothetical protein